jgi:hypothetical protein
MGDRSKGQPANPNNRVIRNLSARIGSLEKQKLPNEPTARHLRRPVNQLLATIPYQTDAKNEPKLELDLDICYLLFPHSETCRAEASAKADPSSDFRHFTQLYGAPKHSEGGSTPCLSTFSEQVPTYADSCVHPGTLCSTFSVRCSMFDVRCSMFRTPETYSADRNQLRPLNP